MRLYYLVSEDGDIINKDNIIRTIEECILTLEKDSLKQKSI
ncbi:hypothetical protein [Clostridium estertheticum]|nr:hypothetical protein [Clostridium estertheticum]